LTAAQIRKKHSATRNKIYKREQLAEQKMAEDAEPVEEESFKLNPNLKRRRKADKRKKE